MIQRVVLIWFADGVERPQREEIASAAKLQLGGIAGVRRIEVGLQVDIRSGFDMSIVLLFDDLEAVETFRQDPAHRHFADAVLGPCLGGRKLYNFDLVS